MPSHAERLRAFSAALLDPAQAVPDGLVGPDGLPCPRRFAVYRNNVVAGLIAALAQAYPATARIVGPAFFRAMARPYVLAEPPRSPILLDYGAGFPDFVETFPPAAGLPYLADVARIERAWTEAYHAPEATPLEAGDLLALPADRCARLRLLLHPSLRIVRSPLPAATIWRMNVGDGVPGPVDLAAGGEDALILRPEAEVALHGLSPGGAAFVGALLAGAPVTRAAAAGFREAAGFDLAGTIAGLVGSGGVVREAPTAPARQAEEAS